MSSTIVAMLCKMLYSSLIQINKFEFNLLIQNQYTFIF